MTAPAGAAKAAQEPGLWLAPLFVLLWSTGFIGAKLGLPHAEPMTFLSVRFALVAALLLVWVLLSGAPWPRRDQIGAAALIGVLMHGVYLGGVFSAISLGVEAGAAALIVGLQPIVTALLAWGMLGERLRTAQVAGLALGFLGAALVVARKLAAGLGSIEAVGLCVMALIAISVGSIAQKRHGADMPMRSGAMVQYLAAAAFTALFAFALETREIAWTGEFIFALTWLTLVLSIGAILLLYTLLQRGAASEVASLFFLVPASTAVIAWAMFGEVLGWVEMAGVAATAAGVWLVLRKP